MSEQRRGNPVMTGVLVAVVGLVVAGALGYLLMVIGERRLEAAKKTVGPYRVALAYIAARGVEAVGKAESSVTSKDWGQAQRALDEAGQVVTVMEQAATEENKPQIQAARAALSEAQNTVGKQDEQAANKVAELRRKLNEFTGPTG